MTCTIATNELSRKPHSGYSVLKENIPTYIPMMAPLVQNSWIYWRHVAMVQVTYFMSVYSNTANVSMCPLLTLPWYIHHFCTWKQPDVPTYKSLSSTCTATNMFSQTSTMTNSRVCCWGTLHCQCYCLQARIAAPLLTPSSCASQYDRICNVTTNEY